jgi:hypothetical protein
MVVGESKTVSSVISGGRRGTDNVATDILGNINNFLEIY